MMLASILLLWTHYLAFAGLYTALGCDYFLFGRHQRRLAVRQWLFLLGPQLLAGICAVAIYNPVGADAAPQLPGHHVGHRQTRAVLVEPARYQCLRIRRGAANAGRAGIVPVG